VTIMITATNDVPQELSGVASALLNSTQQIGMALGVAVLSSIATARAGASLALQVSSVQVVAQTAGYYSNDYSLFHFFPPWFSQ
jgi:hypothetical protein